MENKSVEERAKDVITELRPILSKLGWNDAAEIEQKVYHTIIDIRQDQGIVGTQGREAFIDKVINFSRDGFHKFHELADFMRANWPVSEGEGMNG